MQQLSGGQCQRLCITRPMALRPVVIADEALSGFDVTSQVQVVKLVRDSAERPSASSHDLRTVERLADRVAVMQNGEVVVQAATAALLAQPRHPSTQSLLASLLPIRFRDHDTSNDVDPGASEET